MSPSRCLLLAFLVALVAADDMSEGVTTAIESNFVPSGCEQLLANGVFSVFLGVSRVTYSSAAQSQFQSAMVSAPSSRWRRRHHAASWPGRKLFMPQLL